MADSDTYQAKVIAPNLLRVLEVQSIQENTHILDLACGQGYFLRHVMQALPPHVGVHVQGVDISSELLDIAKKELGHQVTFHHADAAQLKPIADRSIDLIYCILALQNMSDVSAVISEVSRVLRKHGRCIFVLNHPAFRIPKQSDWHVDAERNMQGRVVYTYMSDKKFAIDMHPGKTAEGLHKEETLSFHHPLQYYAKIFAKHGFAITRLEEWISHKVSQDGPKKQMEDSARKEIPMFMCLEIQPFYLQS